MRVLVVNAGSSSLKLALLDGEDRALAERELRAPRRPRSISRSCATR